MRFAHARDSSAQDGVEELCEGESEILQQDEEEWDEGEAFAYAFGDVRVGAAEDPLGGLCILARLLAVVDRIAILVGSVCSASRRQELQGQLEPPCLVMLVFNIEEMVAGM